MRLLTFNDISVDIDEQTAIGVTIQCYDFKEPAKRKVKISNTFTIPKTSHNLALIGFAGNFQVINHKVYDLIACNYWVDNEQLIKNARVRIDEVSDRISIFVYEKPDIWEQIKLYKWSDFSKDLITWMQEEKGLPSLENPYEGDLDSFLEPYFDSTEGIILSAFYSNMYNYEGARPTEDTGYLEGFYSGASHILLNYPYDFVGGIPSYYNLGGHFSIYLKTIFQFLEQKYSVNFLTQGGLSVGNIWDDVYALEIYIPLRNLDIFIEQLETTFRGYFRAITNDDIPFIDEENPFMPLSGQKDKNDKTVYDLVNAFFQKFNIIKDDIILSDGSEAIRLARFDDIKTKSAIVDWSGLISGTPKFKPYINGYGQRNIIKANSVYPNGDSLLNSRSIICNNKNLDAQVELFGIDEYIPLTVPITGGVLLDLSTSESFSTFEFLISDGEAEEIYVWAYSSDGQARYWLKTIKKAAIYSLVGEYLFVDEILAYPKFFEVDKWLRLIDIKKIEFFKQYWIRELGASFFINKISGFNPQKSNEPTKIELILTSYKTPQPTYASEYYTDGPGDPFVDGAGNYFY